MTENKKVIKRKKHNYDENKKSGTEWNTQIKKCNKRLIARRRKRPKGLHAKENIGGKGDDKQKEQRNQNAGRDNRDEG